MIFLADVDDTLVAENTTVGFVLHLLDAEGAEGAAARVRALAGRRGLHGWALAALHRLTGMDRARPRILAELAGRRREELERGAEAYVTDLLARAGIPATLGRLDEARAAGADVVLVSATVDPVAAALARRLGVAYRSSTLAWDADGRCTGRLAADLTGRKLEAVEDLLEGHDEVTVMTDNRSDRPLVARADRRLVVLRRPADAAAWRDLDPEFLGPGPT